MNDKRKQSEPEFLTGLKAFIERKQNEIIYNLAQKELNLRALLPQGEELSEREDTLLSRMERSSSALDEIKPSKKSSENVETMKSSRKEDILEGVGMMLPEGSREKMRKSNKERKEAFDRALKEKPLMDRIQGFFRTDDSEDRALLEALESYNEDLDYRTKYSNRGGGGEKPLKAEYRKAIDTLLQQAKLGKRS